MKQDKQDQTDQIGMYITNNRQFKAMMGYGLLEQYDSTVKAAAESGAVQGDRRDPLGLRIFYGVFITGLVLSCLCLIGSFLGGFFSTFPSQLLMTIAEWGIPLCAVPLCIVGCIQAFLEKRRWQARMRQADLIRQQKTTR